MAHSQELPPQADLLSKAIALHQSNKLAEAAAIYQTLMTSQPNNATVLNLLGTLYFQQSKLEEGVQLIEQAIALKPDYIDAHVNYGVALMKLARHEEASKTLEKALALNPNDANILNLLGTAFFQKGKHKQGLEFLQKATIAAAHYAKAHYDYGVALLNLGSHHEALASFEKAVALKPDDAESYWNISLVKLLLGEYEEGWKLYEWRWKKEGHGKPRTFNAPLWLGAESLSGKTILLYAEQGFGDTIQWCRYVPMVQALGAKVIVEVQEPLLEILSTLKNAPYLIPRGNDLPETNFQCPLSSLPHALKTSIHTIPNDIPYLFANPHKQKTWQKRLGEKTKPRIGLVWSGSITNSNDRNRSTGLQLLESLLHFDFDYHAVQKDIRPADEAILKTHSHITSHSAQLQNFADTAALIAEMDLVLSVDTSVAHLAGALGKPVWILLPYLPDFRWMTTRQDSPWYPTAKLFRQPAIGDWTSVIDQMKAELATFRP